MSDSVQDAGLRLAGFKAGATNEAARARLGLPMPFWGPLFGPDIRTSPASLAVPCTIRGAELEWTFKLAEELAPRPAAAGDMASYSEAEVAAAVECVMPSVELAGSRVALEASEAQLKAVPQAAGILTIADQAGHGALIIAPQQAMSLHDWDKHVFHGAGHGPVVCEVNGQEAGSGTASSVMGSPLHALTWLVNAVTARGISVPAGAHVATGTMTPLVPCKPGDTVVGKFDGAGIVEIQLQG